MHDHADTGISTCIIGKREKTFHIIQRILHNVHRCIVVYLSQLSPFLPSFLLTPLLKLQWQTASIIIIQTNALSVINSKRNKTWQE